MGADTADGRGSVRGWSAGVGWGWVWGPDDQIGALNAMTAISRLEALSLVTRGAVFDLGVCLDRQSFRWAGHIGTEVLPFRTPQGIKRQGDLTPLGDDRNGLSFATSMVQLSDHAGTQLDGLCHATTGTDDHWYNGFASADWSSDFGPRRAGAENIPPVVARGVLLDVAAFHGADALGTSYAIEPDELEEIATSEDLELRPGDVVCIRTGTMRHWGEYGDRHDALAAPNTSGITLRAARWLCEERGAMVIASDTATLEVVPAVDGRVPQPVHEYLLVEQGVHMGEMHNFEELSQQRTFEFCYVALCPKVRGTTAGFALRPMAMV